MRKVLCLILVVFMIFSFCGCIGQNSGDTSSNLVSDSPYDEMFNLVNKGKIDITTAHLNMSVSKAKEIFADEYYNISEMQKGNQTLLNVYSDPNIKLYYQGSTVDGIAILGNCYGLTTGITTVTDVISLFGPNTTYEPNENETFFFFGESPTGLEAIKYTCGDNTLKLFFEDNKFCAAFLQTNKFEFIMPPVDDTSSINTDTSSIEADTSSDTNNSSTP